jgi:hypothetical protein
MNARSSMLDGGELVKNFETSGCWTNAGGISLETYPSGM